MHASLTYSKPTGMIVAAGPGELAPSLALASARMMGDDVRIGEGAFVGLEAMVISILPARARVRVLMEFLGRKIEADCQSSLITQGAGMWNPNQALRNPLLA
jgi:hypothetical protein